MKRPMTAEQKAKLKAIREELHSIYFDLDFPPIDAVGSALDTLDEVLNVCENCGQEIKR